MIRNALCEDLFAFVLAFAMFMGLPLSDAMNKRKSSSHVHSTGKRFVLFF
jgi:hypothetical protein